MCGIAGIYKFNSSADVMQLKRMTDSIAHRGPDGEGFWKSEKGNLCLGHRRLSIIDLSEKAKQPMHYLNRYTLTFNGEIYNYIELKEELLKKNYQFNSDSDTEVLLAAYHEYGEACLQKLDGMFAFAIYDSVEEKLFCARDRFGEKPFYFFYEEGKQFVFASEIKCFWAAGFERSVNHRMVFYYLEHDLLENPLRKEETFFENIFKLKAAHYCTVSKEGKMETKKYWQLNWKKINTEIKIEEATETFSSLFFQSVKRRLRSDVTVGSSLSGGLDSSSVVAAIQKIKPDTQLQKTFTARFHDASLDEGEKINFLKKKIPVNSFDVWCDANSFAADLKKMLWHQDEPMIGTSPAAQWQVMKLAQQEKTIVLLDGQGADETIAGYPKYFAAFFSELNYTKNNSLNDELEEFEKLYGVKFLFDKRHERANKNPKLFSFLSTAKTKLFDKYPSPFKIFQTLNETLAFDSCVYGLEKLLRFSDRNAMAFSREVRLPYLNHELVEFVFSLPANFKMHNGRTKFILRKASNYLLPEEIVWEKRKTGFEPPENEWLKYETLISPMKEANNFLMKEKIILQHKPLNALRAIELASLFNSNFL